MSRQGIVLKICGLLLAATFLSACVTTPKKVAPALQQAARHNQKGLRAEVQKIFKLAEAEFAEAYLLYSSVENYQGMVITLVNSSRIYRHSGQLEKAEKVTDRAVAIAGNAPELAAEVWFEKAKLQMLQNRNDEALIWSEKARNAALELDKPRMLNLSAEIQQNIGVRAQAGQFAEEALKLSRKSGDRREEANALRLLGALELFEKRPRTAVDHYSTALAIDKELALSKKISADLRGLSRSFEAMGDIPASASYLQRAVDSALADADRKQALLDLEKLSLLYGQNNQKVAAEKAEDLRRKLLQEYK